ncbi:UDP-2,3-diacylglucosamine diphosphatase [bacterium]|nr:UDP-2,3-diacylglucosamine diphosphatase [bacterium]
MSIIAISDLHLGPSEDAMQADFVDFLDHIKVEAENLIINGDLFSFWFGYRDVVPYCYLPSLAKMTQLVDHGVRFTYLHGNHDFVPGPFFERYLPATIIENDIRIEYLGAKVHVEHGDLVDRDDFGYRLLRTVVRSRPITWLFRLAPPHIGLGVANACAHVSRNYVVSKGAGFYYFCYAAAYDRMKDGADLVLYGHGHRTIYSEMVVDGRMRIMAVVGGWAKEGLCFLRLSKKQSGLFVFDPSTKKERALHIFDCASLGKKMEDLATDANTRD